MFKWLGQRTENKERKTRQLSEKEINISPMFKWLGQRAEKRKRKTRQLWEREFNIVNEGLDEEQVIAFVDNLIAEQKASQQASAASLRSVLKTAVTNAEQVVASIKMKAQAEAEDEAATIISQANQETEEIKRKAEIAAQKEAEDILSAANRKAEIAEIEAKQKARLFLLRAREDVEKEVRGEYKKAYARLSSSLQDLMSEGQNIVTELKDKRERLWESKDFELKEHEAALLSTSGAAAVLPETSAPTETQIEPDIVSKEEIAEPTRLQEEAIEEVIEQPVQLQEEPPKEEIAEPTRLQEEAIEEVIEQPVQLQEEPPKEEIAEPTQPRDEVTVSEPVEATTEEHLLEERPSREEANLAPLKEGSQTLYAGEVELAIAMPVDLVTVSKLYNHLQTMPELRILRTTGSWDRGTSITVVLDKPIPLINIISKISGVEVTPELPSEDSLAKATSSSSLGARRGVKRIKITLREAQPSVGG